jgi:hypothetical protein
MEAGRVDPSVTVPPQPVAPQPDPSSVVVDDAETIAEGVRLVGLATERGIGLRLLGGLAVRVRSPEWRYRPTHGRDIDLAARSGDRARLSSFVQEQGYRPDRHYNALYGRKQLYFYDDARRRALDVLVDRLEMCHVLPFTSRLTVDPTTLPLAELALSKLQIVQITRKDLLDLAVLLADHPLGDTDGAAVNAARIVELTSHDWGWWRTVIGNLERLERFIVHETAPGELDFGRPPRHDSIIQLRSLRERVERAPKSRAWRVRALVGERIRWYDLPEETEH